MESRKDSNAQAEIISISLAKSILKTNSLTNCTLYTTFEPSQQILNLAIESHIHSLYYGAKDLEDGAFNSARLPKREKSQQFRIEIVNGLLENDSKSLLDSFFRAHQRESPDQTLLSSRGMNRIITK
jgi:tRNA(adenine34) deaminase